MNASPWFYVAWVGGVCLCIIILMVTVNIVVAVLRNIRKPPPPPAPPTPGAMPSYHNVAPWDGNGRG
jgi:hypothetical protein